MHCHQDLSIKQEADSMTLHRIIIMRSIDGEGEKRNIGRLFSFPSQDVSIYIICFLLPQAFPFKVFQPIGAHWLVSPYS